MVPMDFGDMDIHCNRENYYDCPKVGIDVVLISSRHWAATLAGSTRRIAETLTINTILYGKQTLCGGDSL